jgi:Putative stress-induced transcription regulator
MSVANATPVDGSVDWFEDGEGYVSWLEQAKLVPADVLREMRRRALPGELDRVADQARSLREWFRGFVHQRMGRPLANEVLAELRPLNHLLERDETFRRIAPPAKKKEPLELQTVRGWRHPDALLLPVAPEGLRRPGLYAALRRSHARSCPAVVQHGDVR